METKSSVILSFDTQQCWAGHFAARHPHICHLGASRVDRRVAPPAASAVGDTGTIRHDMISRALVVFVNNKITLQLTQHVTQELAIWNPHRCNTQENATNASVNAQRRIPPSKQQK